MAKKGQLEKFYTKKKESETKKETVNLLYQVEDVKESFVKAKMLYKEAKFNEGTKNGIIIEAIKSDLSLLHSVLLRKVWTLEHVKETFFEYAEHPKVYSVPKRVTTDVSCVLNTRTHKKSREKNKRDAFDKMDMLCKKFEDLALIIRKSKPKANFQDIICHKCK